LPLCYPLCSRKIAVLLDRPLSAGKSELTRRSSRALTMIALVALAFTTLADNGTPASEVLDHPGRSLLFGAVETALAARGSTSPADQAMRSIKRIRQGYLMPLLSAWNIPEDERVLQSVGNSNVQLFRKEAMYLHANTGGLLRDVESRSLSMSGRSSMSITSEMYMNAGMDVDVDMGFFGIGASVTATLDAEFGASTDKQGAMRFDRVYREVKFATLKLPSDTKRLGAMLTTDTTQMLGLNCGRLKSCDERGAELKRQYQASGPQACFSIPAGYRFPEVRAGSWINSADRCNPQGWGSFQTRWVYDGNHALYDGSVDGCARKCKDTQGCSFFDHSHTLKECNLFQDCNQKRQGTYLANDFYVYELQPTCSAYSKWAEVMIDRLGAFYHSEASFGGRLDVSRMYDGADTSFDAQGTLNAVIEMIEHPVVDSSEAELASAFSSGDTGVTTRSVSVGGLSQFADSGGEATVHMWLSTIHEQPGIIDFTATPLYELFDEWSVEAAHQEKRAALRTAFIMHMARHQPTIGCPTVGNLDLDISDISFCEDLSPPPPSPPHWLYTSDATIRSQYGRQTGYEWCVNAQDGLFSGGRLSLWPCDQGSHDRQAFKWSRSDGAIRSTVNPNLCWNIENGVGANHYINLYDCGGRHPWSNEKFTFGEWTALLNSQVEDDGSIRSNANHNGGLNLCVTLESGINHHSRLCTRDCTGRDPDQNQRFSYCDEYYDGHGDRCDE